MTRDIERRLEQLEDDTDPGTAPDLETSITRALVMSRARAEREGREILGPADVAADGDFVRVDPYELTPEDKEALDRAFDVEPDT